jgi:hypothetical protein
VTAVLVTRFGNVPINQLFRKWLTAPPPADYLEALHRWTVFNDVRSAAAVFGFVLILIADALLDANTGPVSLACARDGTSSISVPSHARSSGSTSRWGRLV